MKYLRIMLVLIFTFSVTGLSSQALDKNAPYISLKALSDKYDFQHESDGITGREIFSGSGTRIIICAGMMTALVNEKLLILEDYAKTINGEISVTSGDLEKIEKQITEYQTTYKKKEWGIRKIVIDPGHGGNFKGAQGTSGILEKEINLRIAHKLKLLLQSDGIKVIMTREKDNHLSPNLNEDLNSRVAIANREQPDLFISIHCNWAKQSSANGFEIYYCNDKPLPAYKSKKDNSGELDSATRKIISYALREEFQQESLDFSREVQRIFDQLPTNNRGIHTADFRVIKQTECPAILVEVDFISNHTMCKKLSSDSYQCEIAQKLAKSIFNYQERLIATQGFAK
jgi:N-acetylmuramoyl-L-alanine amidase